MAEPLLVIREGADAGREVAIEGSLTVGRAAEADLVVEDSGISRTHARVSATAGGAVTIEDLGSSNGTFVNGEAIEGAHELRDGDEIQLGGALLAFVGASEETRVLAPPTDPDATAAHPGPAAAPPPPPDEQSAEGPPPWDPIPPPAPRRGRGRGDASPARGTAPAGTGDIVDDHNLPAIAAIILGPLSILFLVFSSGSAFYAALPLAIVAVAMGTIGRNKVDRGESARYRGLASAGRTFGIVGTILASVILIAVIVIAEALDVSAESVSELIDEIRSEIESR